MDLELTVVQRAKPELGYIAGLAVGDELIVAVGGTSRHAPTVLASSDARHFEPRKTPRQLGLRDVLVVGSAIWTCGEYGQLAVSRDRGESWKVIDTGCDSCLFGLALAADGAVWVCGADGYVARIDDPQKRLERIQLDTTTRLTAIYCVRDEVIALGLDGVMYRWRAGAVTKFVTGATKQLTALAITKAGTWLVIGDGGFVARSPDGAWFSRVKAGVEHDLESIAPLADGRVVMVGDRGTIVLSTDDGRTWAPVESDVSAHLWSARRFGAGLLIGGDDGLVLQLAPQGDRAWNDRIDIFGNVKPLDGVLALGPAGFLGRLPAYIATLGCEAAKDATVAPSTDAFARIYGVALPSEVDALFAATRGRDCFDELHLDATLIADVGDENVFERVLASGATDAFCGVFCIGAQSSGGSYHMELYEWDGPRQVLHYDRSTRAFSGVIADSLESLVYLAALVRAEKRRLISDEVFTNGLRKLHGKVAPTFDVGEGFVKLDAKRRDTEFFFYRSRWICALLDGRVEISEIPPLFMADFNQIVPNEQLSARFEACERIIPTALYSMWRAFVFDEPELARYLEIGSRHKSRLVRDAAKLIAELRNGRNTLGTIGDVRARLAAFRALELDPRRAMRRTEIESTPRDRWTDLAWRWVDDGVAQRALLAKLVEEPALAAQVEALDKLRWLPDVERERAVQRLAKQLAPELEAILAGSIVRGDDLSDALGRVDHVDEIKARAVAAHERVQAALAMTTRALALDPHDDTTEYTHSVLLLEAGKAEELVARWPSLSSQNQEALIDQIAPALNDACVQAHAEKAFDVAVRLAHHAQQFASAHPYLYHSAACAFAAVGDYAGAFEQVKLAIEHNAERVADMEVDSDLGPLLDWPEFKA
ncbi:MAG TPA: hypothetical protein VMZ53_28500, partial [Kofleriaceae bacterium]|nr:hypothetical protein [Kofleriaceae bacterium]